MGEGSFALWKLSYIALCKFIPFWLRFSPIWVNFVKDFFSRIWLTFGWQVCILGLLSAKCSYLLKPCFNYIFQVSILSISRKIMEGNDKLKSSKWKVLRRNQKSQIWNKHALSEYFRFKFEKANFIYEINSLEFIQLPKIEQNNDDNSNNENGYFWGSSVFLGQNFEKLLSYLKSAHSNLSNCWISPKKKKCLNLGPKISYLGVSGEEF